MADNKKVQVGNKETKMDFEVSQPYAEGHVLTIIEAKTLNQTRTENVCNNMRGKVKAHIEGAEDALDEAELRKEFKAYDKKYVFTEASAGSSRATQTPLEKAARKIAHDLVVHQVKESGRTVKAVTDTPEKKEAFAAEVARFAETEQVQKIAAKRVKEMDALTANLQAPAG